MRTLLKIILTIITIITALIGCAVVLCAFDPTLADDIANMIYKDSRRPVAQAQRNLPGNGGLAQQSGSNMNDNREDKPISPFLKTSSMEEEAEGEPEQETEQESGQESGAQNESPDERSSAGGDFSSDDAISGSAPTSSYEQPDPGAIDIPEGVQGKSDYKTIEVKETVVEDDSAAALGHGLDVGETGQGLNFDPLYYPYYSMLNDTGKAIYRQIYANAMSRNGAFVPVKAIGRSGLRTVIEALFNDQPQLFWLDTSYSCKYKSSGQCVEIDLAFNRTAENFEKENTSFTQAAKRIADDAKGYSSDVDKERYVHDAIIDLVDYVRSCELSQSAYSALVNRQSVCAGYARAFQYIMQNLGIPCYYVVGSAGEDHAWNMVKLGDGFYNVDLTWDDIEGGNYDYFNKTDADYAPTHVRQELSTRLPACKATANREPDPDLAERARRSLADVGYEASDVLYDIQSYYNSCSYQIKNRGIGNYEFTNLIGGEELYNAIDKVYADESYRDYYLTDAMKDIGARTCRMSLQIERLKDDIYLMKHDVGLE